MNLDETSGAFDEVENESVMVTSAEDIEDEDGGQPLVDPQDILDEEGEALEEAFDAAVDLEAIKEHYAETGSLSDLEMDAVADLSVSYLRQILACFGEGDATIDEYESDEGELILDVSEGDLAILIGRHGRTLEAARRSRHSWGWRCKSRPHGGLPGGSRQHACGLAHRRQRQTHSLLPRRPSAATRLSPFLP